MDVAHYQQTIKSMLKGDWTPKAATDPYFKELHHSPNMAMVREIAVWWRAFQLENFCPLSSGYLKRLGTYQSHIEQFYRSVAVSSFIEEAAKQFFAFLPTQETDTTLHSLLAFEQALMEVKRGSKKVFEIEWSMNPYDVIHYAMGGPEVAPQEKVVFRSRVSGEVEGYFLVWEV